MRTLLVSMIISLFLYGCATPHRCELINEDGYCSSVEDTYKAAVQGGGDNENVLSYNNSASGSAINQLGINAESPNQEKSHSSNAFTKPAKQKQSGKPVYTPPKVWRLKVFAWKDKNDVLHGGEDLFFNTPGNWNYGTLRETGSAADLLAPLTPNQLGFKSANTSDKRMLEPMNNISPKE